MLMPLPIPSPVKSNEINFFSDSIFEDLYPKISIEEIDDLGDAYPFHSCGTRKMIQKEKFKTIFTIRSSRRDKADDIRKKIKSGFHKRLREIINTKLKEAGSKYFLESFPQNFIVDATFKTNFEVMHLTYEELFDYTYNKVINEDKNKEVEIYIEKRNKVGEKKYLKNKEVLKYLNSNEKISKESGWERIKKMKYIDLLKAYLNSNEFQQYIMELSQKEAKNYIYFFLYFASTYIDDYLRYKSKKNKSQRNNVCHSGNNYNNIPTLNIPSLIPFPPSIIDMTEDNDMGIQESLLPSLNEDFCLTSTNSFLTNENFYLK